MTTYVRPTKIGGYQNYVDEVATGHPQLPAKELDDDLNVLYNAVNHGLPSSSGGGAATAVSPTPPGGAVQGQLWWRNNPDGNLYVYYDDGNSAQWVSAVPNTAQSSVSKWSIVGNTVTPVDPAKTIACAPIAPAFRWGIGPVRGRLIDDGLGGMQWRTNITHDNVVDDTSKSQWVVATSATYDVFDIFRSPPGATVAFADLLRLDSRGSLLITGNLYIPHTAVISDLGGSGGPYGRFIINSPSFAGYIAAKSSWYISLETDVDSFAVWRQAPNNGGFSTPFTVSATGQFNFYNGGAALMYNDAAGNLSIGGSTATKPSGTTWANPSDIRIKKNITKYDAGLAEILKLSPVQFEHNGFAGTVDGTVCYGYLADDVKAVMPECVGTMTRMVDEKELELDLLDTSNISLAVVNAIKELAARITALEAR